MLVSYYSIILIIINYNKKTEFYITLYNVNTKKIMIILIDNIINK